ncbi:MAG: calcium-binding protein [Phenylobacterium sp.]
MEATVPNNTTNVHGPKGDILAGTASVDDLTGKSGDDSLSGLDGNDMLHGGRGDDTVDGGAGDDSIWGGVGSDLLTGGAGRDTFFIEGQTGATMGDLDRITDFTHGEDRIGFGGKVSIAGHGFTSGTAATYDDALTFAAQQIQGHTADIVAVQVGGDVVVFADADLTDKVGGAAVLVGKTLTDIGQWDVF